MILELITLNKTKKPYNMAQFLVEWIESKQSMTGKQYKKCSLKDEQGVLHDVSVWPDFQLYEQVTLGNAVEGVIQTKGQFKNLVSGNLSKFGPRPQALAQAQERKAQYIEKAQDKKELSIAFFNATNSAISLYSAAYGNYNGGGHNYEKEQIETFITHWRDWFLQEWSVWQAKSVEEKKQPF